MKILTILWWDPESNWALRVMTLYVFHDTLPPYFLQ